MNVTTLKRSIDTIFIVMLENRAFDHALGARPGGNVPPLSNASSVGPRSFNPARSGDAWLDTDLPHGRDDVTTQLASGTMRGFVGAYEKAIGAAAADNPPPMRLCEPSDVPITTFLADEYCVCNRWHAALPTDTQPNRLMAMSGTSLIDNTHMSITSLLPDQYTILDWLAANVHDRPSFAIYVDHDPIPLVGHPTNFLLMPRLWPVIDGKTNTLSSLASDMGGWDPGATDASARPPAVVYCEPYYNDLATLPVIGGGHGNCNHAPLPMAFGEDFLKRVYDAVSTANPAVWQRSVLLVVYDENGGFFDHVAPPSMPLSPPSGARWTTNAPFATLGVRVPAIVVSPWTARGSACGSLFDHTSILQLVTDRFGDASSLRQLGDSVARRQRGIRSVTDALTDTATPGSPAASPAAPAPPPAPGQGGAVMTDNARLWAAALVHRRRDALQHSTV